MSEVQHISPFPKMSMGNTKRKSALYLQKCKDEGKKIVQHCPSMLSPLFSMAAMIADVDIARLAPSVDASYTADQTNEFAPNYIKSYRAVANTLHLNYVCNAYTWCDKHTALKNFVRYHQADVDSMLPMGINNETLKYVSDGQCIVYGHVGALSGWMTNGLFGGYKKITSASSNIKVFQGAYEYQENGMKAMSVELVPGEVSAAIAKKLRVPVIGIAGYAACDGSEMVDEDTFGIAGGIGAPIHAKTYGDFFEWAGGIYSQWVNDVRTGAYPAEENMWHMDPVELEKFNEAFEKTYK